MSKIEEYAKDNFNGSICLECSYQGRDDEFHFVTHHAVTCWGPDSCSEEESESRCPSCGSKEDYIRDQGDLFVEVIGDRFEDGMEYHYFDCGLNDIEEAHNPHIMIVEEATGYVEERIDLC